MWQLHVAHLSTGLLSCRAVAEAVYRWCLPCKHKYASKWEVGPYFGIGG